MSWDQKEFTLDAKSRGCYLITDQVIANLPIADYKIGMLNLFIKHTSAAISLNENWDPDVRHDMTTAMNLVVPDDTNGEVFRHTDEGPDDMSGHVKSSLIGVSLNIPISNGKLALGTWQGVYLMEFRDYKHRRTCIGTLNGVKY